MIAWHTEQTSGRTARWVVLAILVVILLSWRAFGEDKTTVQLSNGSQVTVSCQHQPGTTSSACQVYDSTPSLWSVLKENKARNQFCKAQHLKRGTPECGSAWDQHKAEESLKEAK